MVQNRIYNYFERNPQLHVLFIFDRMSIIQTELDEATDWADGYIYKVFDGAWFNTKYAIENQWKDKRVVLLFPSELYPMTEEQQLKFPLLDMLKANMEYKEDDYAAYMQQYGLPEKFRGFVKKNIGEMMSSRVSNILNGHVDNSSFSEDLVCRAFITNYLGEKKLLEWEQLIVKLIILDGTGDEKKRIDFWYKLGKNQDAMKALAGKLDKLFGLTLNTNTSQRMKMVAESLKYNSITQLLDPVAGDTYKPYKISNSVMLDQVNKIYELGTHDRGLSEKFSQAMRSLAADIKEESIISIYGIDANYYYLTETLCWPILEKIVEQKLMTDPEEVNDRMRELSLKLPIESNIQIVIRFIEQAALYYIQVRGIGTLKLNSTKEYVEKYVGEFYLIDMYYRRTLEAYHTLITKENPLEKTLGDAKRQLDQDYAKMTNVLNLEWLTYVEEKGRWFEETGLNHQEDFYTKESDSNVKQVVIVSDALRYEVAMELMQELAKEKHVATIGAYQAMLPTETKFCKPALLPHHSLELQGTDMAVDGMVLTTTEQRTTHLCKYRDGAVCVRYEDVMNGNTQSMRELFKRPLVYIFHDTIDEASHSQNVFEVISACRKAVEQLAVIVKKLHANWNVTNVLLTADHGFLYNDMKFEEKDKHSITDIALEKKTRYYLTESTETVEGIVKFPLEKVSGIQCGNTMQVAVPVGTNRLAASGGYNFAHGGASLQEMIIPIIKSVRKKTDKTEKVGVALMSHNLNMVSSRLKFQLIQSEAVSMTVMERKVVCCIYNGDAPVTQEKELTLNSTDAVNLNNRVYEVTLNLCKSVNTSMLQLRIYDVDDRLNPLVRETVKNNTIIEQDF
ncbi:BREX-1 system phosphatase PglZ type A [Bacteroides congonensis]|uniref:BREX-1 system phosphatase PglZ type A n=1 Tax=Bacteroides congonensis TaxID=1871006 RepID=UPI00189ED07E|nr:BREX-1 system phosphatase PglZ type A [Bacteroides congonensis]